MYGDYDKTSSRLVSFYHETVDLSYVLISIILVYIISFKYFSINVFAKLEIH